MTLINTQARSVVPTNLNGAPAARATDFGAQLRSPNLSGTGIYRAIGMAEGTISASGQKTSAWYGHGDPGNGALNRGFGSYQVYQHPRGASLSAAEADRVQADRLAAQWPRIDQALSQAGFPAGPARDLVAASVLDAYNQAPATLGGKNGLLNPARLKELKGALDRGQSPIDAIVGWRTNGFRTDSGRLDAPGLGNSVARVTADQRRRTEAVAQGLSVTGTAAPEAVAPAAEALAPAAPAAPSAVEQSPAVQAHRGVSSFSDSVIPSKAGPENRLMRILDDVARGIGSLIGGAPASAAELSEMVGPSSASSLGLPRGLDAAPARQPAALDAPSAAQVAPSAAQLAPSAAQVSQPPAADATSARHPWMDTLATSHLNNGRTGYCVETTLRNMDRLGIPSFQGGTDRDPNNPRGALVQMVNGGHWKSLPLEGSQLRTIKSPYGTVQAHVLDANTYERMAKAGQIPSGAVLFQTRHGWDYSGGSRGNDMGIVRDGGRVTHNYKSMSPIIYGDAKDVVVLVPR